MYFNKKLCISFEIFVFFFQAEDGIRDYKVTGVQTCALPILTRGTSLTGLGGGNPFAISVAQPRFWVYLDPTWDWQVLDYANYEAFFDDTVRMVRSEERSVGKGERGWWRSHSRMTNITTYC